MFTCLSYEMIPGSMLALLANEAGQETAVWTSSWNRGDNVWEERQSEEKEREPLLCSVNSAKLYIQRLSP